ncbi:hypothetical protein FOL47_005079 [Perkinsus chesapeaki]|uniref:Uncharacterized protein n=1 Tax=Perkinsus chesapeaki TaxID=330153 RepID=A0A7J6LZ16_PERCH|nr:hypothetical protein FOL47_005079 [Perkinsus chesapeaki]
MTGPRNEEETPASPTSSELLMQGILDEDLPFHYSDDEEEEPRKSSGRQGGMVDVESKKSIFEGETLLAIRTRDSSLVGGFRLYRGPFVRGFHYDSVTAGIKSGINAQRSESSQEKAMYILDITVASNHLPRHHTAPFQVVVKILVGLGLRRASNLIMRIPTIPSVTPDTRVAVELHKQLALARSRCHELEQADKIHNSDITALRASNMALRAEVNSAKRQVKLSNEEAQSLRHRLDATSRALSDLKSSNAALEAQTGILLQSRKEQQPLHEPAENRKASIVEGNKSTTVTPRQRGIQTDEHPQVEMVSSEVLGELKRKLMTYEERDAKYSRFLPGIEFIQRHAEAMGSSTEDAHGGELWLRVIAYLDERIEGLEEDNRTMREREDRRAAASEVDGETVQTIKELQQQLRIKNDLIESLVKRQANTLSAESAVSREEHRSFWSLAAPMTSSPNGPAASDSTTSRLVELSSILAYERDRRRQLEALLQEQTAATGTAIAERDRFKRGEDSLLVDFRSLASQVSLLLRELHTITTSQGHKNRDSEPRRTRSEATSMRALQSLQKQLVRLTQRADNRTTSSTSILGQTRQFTNSVMRVILLVSLESGGDQPQDITVRFPTE